MAPKQPKIRLKKTELPMTGDVAQTLADGHRAQVLRSFQDVYNPLFYRDGNRISGVTPKQVSEFKAVAVEPSGLTFNPLHFKQFFTKLLNIQSAHAPWTWNPVSSLSGEGAWRSTGSTSPFPDIWDWSGDAPFTWKFVIPDLVPTPEDGDLRGKALSQRLSKSWLHRALSRYIYRLNKACLLAGVPVWFDTRCNPTERDFETKSKFVIAVQMQLSSHWLRTEKVYRTHLRGDEQAFLPASFLPEEAVKSLNAWTDFDEDNSKLVFMNYSRNVTSVAAPYFSSGDIPSPWIAAILRNEKTNVEDVVAGNVPIPPEAEAITSTSLLERIEDLKQITRTLMRISKPYDHLSFFPVDP